MPKVSFTAKLEIKRKRQIRRILVKTDMLPN